MARKTVKRREWTKEDVRILKTLTKEGTKRSVIARKLKRTEGAVRRRFLSACRGVHVLRRAGGAYR